MRNEALLAVRNSLLGYAQYRWREFQSPRHVMLIGLHLEKVESGEIKRLIIEAPPRHGKSLIVSDNFPAWYMGRNPDREVIFGTYAQSLANKYGRLVRNQLADPAFSRIFPGCALTEDSKSKHDFSTEAGGSYIAVGVDGSVTGKGGHLILLDDTLKGRAQAESEAFRDALKDFYRSSIYTRLPPDGSIVIMQTRWHQDDLIGYVLEEHADEGWVRITLPATDEGEQKALWPERWPLDKLLKIKAALGPYDWASLYLQKPAPPEGNIFKREWWKTYKEPPQRFDKMISSWDMSFKEGKENSFVVGQVWGKRDANSYLLYQYRKQVSFTDTLRAFAMVHQQFPKVFRKLVEGKANGPAVMDVLKNKIAGIQEVEPEGTKEARASAVSPIVESGCVYLPDPKQQPWVLDFIEECATFPKAAHDDQVDAMSQALSELYGSHADRLERLLKD